MGAGAHPPGLGAHLNDHRGWGAIGRGSDVSNHRRRRSGDWAGAAGAGIGPERMNSPLELREVRLRGLPRRRVTDVHWCGDRAGATEVAATTAESPANSAGLHLRNFGSGAHRRAGHGPVREGGLRAFPAANSFAPGPPGLRRGALPPPAPDPSAQADIAGSLPRIHSPGLDARRGSGSPPGPPDLRSGAPPPPAPDPSAQADITSSLPRLQSPGAEGRLASRNLSRVLIRGRLVHRNLYRGLHPATVPRPPAAPTPPPAPAPRPAGSVADPPSRSRRARLRSSSALRPA